MIGEWIYSSRPTSNASIAMMTIGAIVLIFGLYQHTYHLSLFSLLIIGWGFGLFLARPKDLTMKLSETEIDMISPVNQTILYSELLFLHRTHEGASKFSFQIVHTNGCEDIPENLNVPIESLFRFLKEKIQPQPPKELSPVMKEYLEEQIKQFGPEQLKVYYARPKLPTPHTRRIWIMGGVFIVVGILWILIGSLIQQKEYHPWVGGGISFIVFTLLFCWVLSATRKSEKYQPKNWEESELVIGPAGWAMKQGSKQGKMRWDEVRGINFSPNKLEQGIRIQIAGGELRIFNIYNGSIPEIYHFMKNLWVGTDN